MSEKVGFIGLGIMGVGMARNLLKAGSDLTVWNRTASKAEDMAGEGAKCAVARFLSVRVLPVAMGKGEGTCRDEEQEESKENAGIKSPVPGQHGELDSLPVNPVGASPQ